MIDKITISNSKPAMLPPLAFVVFLSMFKDAYEDYKRHKEDSFENKAETEVLNRETNKFEKMEWRHVKVGAIVKVNEDSFFPADMVVIHSTEEQGVFYVETKNLDGETNLKLKNVAHDLQAPFENEDSFHKIRGTL